MGYEKEREIYNEIDNGNCNSNKIIFIGGTRM